MPEYGRAVQDMVEQAVHISDRATRQRCAQMIVGVMSRSNPESRSLPDYWNRLWNHLARISSYRLDIDYPVEIVAEERVNEHPAPLHYPMKRISRKHYGALVETALAHAREMAPGPDRDEFVRMIANQMKQNLFQWNRDAMDESLIAQDIERYTQGEVTLNLDGFKFVSLSSPSVGSRNASALKKRKKIR